MKQSENRLHFWNGNKSPMRQSHEFEVLMRALCSDGFNPEIIDDHTNYPRAEDEGGVFEQGADALVTVAGNQKFSGKPFFEVSTPFCWGILGWRSIIISKARYADFQALNEDALKDLTVGVPATWADAELFRANGYPVMEQGGLNDVLGFVAQGRCDYMTLGVNEAEAILAECSQHVDELMILPSISLYYPFPLVFYVASNNSVLAQTLETGLDRLQQSGELAEVFWRHYGNYVSAAKLESGRFIRLNTPFITEDDADKAGPEILLNLIREKSLSIS